MEVDSLSRRCKASPLREAVAMGDAVTIALDVEPSDARFGEFGSVTDSAGQGARIGSRNGNGQRMEVIAA